MSPFQSWFLATEGKGRGKVLTPPKAVVVFKGGLAGAKAGSMLQTTCYLLLNLCDLSKIGYLPHLTEGSEGRQGVAFARSIFALAYAEKEYFPPVSDPASLSDSFCHCVCNKRQKAW